MKKILIFLIAFYQNILSPILKQIIGANSFCRFQVSCSEFAKNELKSKGIIRGGYSSIVRLMSCQPYFRF